MTGIQALQDHVENSLRIGAPTEWLRFTGQACPHGLTFAGPTIENIEGY